jgi:outer membrane immunogenic protein
MLRTLILVGTALGLASSGVLAADLPARAPAPIIPMGFNWTGYYLGIGGGFQAGTVEGASVAGFNIQPTFTYFAVGGAYRFQLPNNLVLGLEVSAPVWVSSNTFVTPGGGTTLSFKPQFVLTPEVQLGYAFDRFLPYVGLGVGVVDTKVSFTPAGATSLSDTELDPLLIVTFGVDYAIANNWIVGVRYDHIETEQRNYTFATGTPPTVVQGGFNSDGVTGVIKYKF